eukprot:TRINITY_DN6578_c0_g3_i2.p1 TRINITY_DN6578_c0_g3~~TRINITY_DN6578_c0_g3_i2.p1  ORF type:complete len:159 (-),score=30.25 TRINITY_DN6578_c0_g3_i2:86-562(-)
MSFLKSKINLRVLAAAAKPNPRLGQALGPLGINMAAFCKEFNEKTQHIRNDVPLRVILFAYSDRSFKFILKPPETTWFLRRATATEYFSGDCKYDYPKDVSIKVIYEIAKIKQEMDPHLQNVPLKSIVQMIIDQCKSCGLKPDFDVKVPPAIKVPTFT